MPIEETITEKIKCKNCGSEAVIKFGNYKGSPRFYCKVCKRKFKADADNFHGKVPADYVSSTLSMYYSGMSVNDICTTLKQEHDYYPSNSVVYYWIDKYTPIVVKHFRDYHPQVGDVWIADETVLNLDGEHSIWFYDIIDKDTRFLLASRVAISRTTNDAERLMEDAKKKAGKSPKEILTDSNKSYLDSIEKVFGSETEHIQTTPFEKAPADTTSEIERFHGTLKDRTKVFRSFRDIDTLIEFTDGWLAYYNYFRPHESLEGKTPAEVSRVKYDVKDWADLMRIPVLKQRIEFTDLPVNRHIKTAVDTSKLMKRIRGHHKPQAVKMIAQHRARRGSGITRRSDR
jgi:putative transposase